jgi:PUA domain protein
MFRKFSPAENISSTSKVKNSAGRAIVAQIVEQYPNLEDAIEFILPKAKILVGKADENTQLVIIDDEILFFQDKDVGPWFPTLRLLHKYPDMMPRMQADKGAIRYVLGGANIMCPGFTSAGGSIPEELAAGQPVAVYAEGKQHCMAVGVLKMSTSDILSLNKGIAVETMHFLADGLYSEYML